MSLARSFTVAYQRGAAGWSEPQLVPNRAAAAAVEVTGIDGVGLGVFDQQGFSVPIGSSCENSALAERLQFTVGQGPCYDAHAQRRTVVASEPVMSLSWPVYHDLLVTQTLFRSVVAMPLTGPLASMATIDLLFHDPDGAAHAPLADIAVLCRHITAALIEADLWADTTNPHATPAEAGTLVEHSGPVWLTSPSSTARNQVMVAVGMLTRHLQVSTSDALKLLKAHAYSGGSTTDHIAAALVAGEIPPATFNLDS